MVIRGRSSLTQKGKAARVGSRHRASLASIFLGLSAAAPSVRARPGDVDADGHVDLADLARLQTCFTGPDSDRLFVPPSEASCTTAFDVDSDGDIDGDDLAWVLCALSGPSIVLPDVSVEIPSSPTRSVSLTLSGKTAGWPAIEITGGVERRLGDAPDCGFSVAVELRPNRVNRLFVRGLTTDGSASPPFPVRIIHDEQAPSVFVDFPADGASLSLATTDVAGRAGDLLSGFAGLMVTVNGMSAVVDVGIGNNGTFLATGVPLAAGGSPTTITATATDALGNSATHDITVTRVEIPKGAATMTALSGNGQLADIGTFLPQPIMVHVARGDGSPFAGKIVTFNVIKSNGRLCNSPVGPGKMALQVRTDTQGNARAFWRLGSDAGCGNNRVEGTSTSVVGTTVFCASATPGALRQINVGSGDMQRAETGGPAAEPLRAWVSDACNGGRDVPVTFKVVRGGGKVNGLDVVTVLTGPTGHAEANFTLGPNPGNNLVEATFPGNSGDPATFVIYGIRREPSQPTGFSGLVLDNAKVPLQGAAVLLRIGGLDAGQTSTNASGQFLLENIALSGQADLFVNGYFVSAAGGQAVGLGTYPSLHFETVVVSNAANSLPTPVLLPALNPYNRRTFTCASQGGPIVCEDVELTCEGMEGLKMILPADTTVTLPTGVRVGPNNPGSVTLSLNQVHHDDVPMPMPDGASPPFAWTLQPGGTRFDPPLEILYPNMSGLPAGAVSFFLSFNHDTGRFEIIGSGQVSADGSSILSDPGVGIATAGWGCNCPPYSVTGECCSGQGEECCPGSAVAAAGGCCEDDDDCGDCMVCQDQECVELTLEVVTPYDADTNGVIDDPDHNEFTFNDADPGELRIEVSIAVLPDTQEVRDKLQDKVEVRIDAIGESQLEWDRSGSDPTVGLATYSGGPWVATATFTGLPTSNRSFGRKKVSVSIKDEGDRCSDDEDIEVFYAGLVSNHPDGEMVSTHPFHCPTNPVPGPEAPNPCRPYSTLLGPHRGVTPVPNWFYYYQQEEGSADYSYGCELVSGVPTSTTTRGQLGTTIVCDSSYLDHKNITYDYDQNGFLRATGFADSTRYYTGFIAELNHERSHACNQPISACFNAEPDPDCDGFYTCFEIEVSHTDPDDPCSAGVLVDNQLPCASFPDGEIYAGGPVATGASASVDTSQDWANPGSNYGPNP